MWNILVLTAMLSFVGYYAMHDQQFVATASAQVTENTLAQNMAIYRQAVIDYYTANPGAPSNTSVSAATLQAAGVFPSWSNASALGQQWSNYINDVAQGRMIYIYPTSQLSTNIVAQIVSLSGGSVLVGQAVVSGGALVLYAPADIPSSKVQTGSQPVASDYTGPYASIALPAAANIAAGSPVWLAPTN